MAYNLEVTEYGTIKGNEDFKEIPVKKLLKKIEKNCELFSYEYDENDTSFNVSSQCAKVFKTDENKYCYIIDDDNYILNLDPHNEYYSLIKSKFDELIEKTKKDEKIYKMINDCENNNIKLADLNKEELKKYLLYIKDYRKLIKKEIIIGFSIHTIFLIIIICVCITDRDYFSSVCNTFSNYFNILKVNKLKGKNIKEKLKKLDKLDKKISKNEDIKDIEKEEPSEIEEKSNTYNETVISYMNSITEDACKLNDKEKIVILNEVKEILDDYIRKMQQNNKDINLSLNNRNSYIYQTIEKLVAIEMKINEINRRNNENKDILDDSILLKEKLDKYLESSSEDIFKQNDDDFKKPKMLVAN